MDFDLFKRRHAGDAAGTGGRKAGSRAGEADDGVELRGCQRFGRLAALQQLMHGGAAKNIAGAGGVDHFDA